MTLHLLPPAARRPSFGRALALVLLACLATGSGCGDDSAPPAPTASEPAEADVTEPEGELARTEDDEPEVETIATGLEVPWEIAFLSDGRALITERPGRVRILSRDGRLEPRPAARIPVSAVGEGGLLGLALDPGFDRNRFVYLFYTSDSDNRLARYRLRGDRLVEDEVVLDGIEPGMIHDGGRIHFGPDDRLYVSTGDASHAGLAQDADSLNGKILRLARDAYRGESGRAEVFSLGHRNSQGFDWHPESEELYADEHGPDGFDEVNLLREDGNYGWPEVRGKEKRPGFEAPLAVYEESIAPSGATFVHRPGSEWSGDYLIGALIGEQIRRLSFDGTSVTRDEALFEGEFGRVRTVVEGPDGALYALTSNRDGRGSVRDGDDRVLRIVPPAG